MQNFLTRAAAVRNQAEALTQGREEATIRVTGEAITFHLMRATDRQRFEPDFAEQHLQTAERLFVKLVRQTREAEAA